MAASSQFYEYATQNLGLN